MLIGITSDTHGDAAAWREACAGWFAGAAAILHAGDVLYHGPRNPLAAGYDAAALMAALNACHVPLLMAMGNCDSPVDADVLDVPLASPYLFAELDGHRVVVTHGHLVPSTADKVALARKLGADLLVSGHTHVGGLERAGGVVLVNPGSPSLTKRPDGRRTIATMSDGAVRLIDLGSGDVLDEMAL